MDQTGPWKQQFMKREVGDMRNYALITTALSALLLGLTVTGPEALAQDAQAALPSPSSASASTPSAASASAPTAAPPTLAPADATASTGASSSVSGQVFVPAAGASSGATASGTAPSAASSTAPMPSSTTSSSVIVPVTSSASTLSGAAVTGSPTGLAGTSGNGLTTSPIMPSAVQDAMTRLQKVDQINLDDMIRAQDAINRLDLLLEIEKRQTELKKIRDDRNKPAASTLLGSAIPASALNLPKISSLPLTPTDTPASSSSFTPKPSFKSSSSGSSSSNSGPSDKYGIKRISGTDGRYFAVINTDDSSSQTVHTGDKLPDGSVVKSISLTSVSLFKDKKSKNLTIPTDSYIVRETGNSTQ
jgi:type IV pilus biogenesis protein PilP